MKRCRGVAVLAVVSALLAVAGCGGKSASSGTPGGAAIVPSTAPAFIAIDTDQGSAQWKAAVQLADRFPGKQKAVDSIEKDLKKSAGLDYSRDIEPALGKELDVVWLDFSGGGTDVVALAQPNDEKAFQRLVARGNAKDPTGKLLYEKVGGWEVMSDTQAKLDRFAHESKAAASKLSSDDTFESAMGALSADGLLRVYVNGAEAMQAARGQGAQEVDKVMNEAGKLDWLAAGVGATSDGLRFDTFVRGTPGKLFKGNTGSVLFHPKLPGSVPGGTIVYLSFHGSKDMLGNLKSVPQLASPSLAPTRALLRQLGSLLQGEDALYVGNTAPGGKLPEVTLLAAPGGGVDGANTLDRILNDPKLKLKQRPHAVTIGGVPAREIDFGGLKLDYADVGGKLVVTDGPAGVSAAAHPATTLASEPAYSAAAKGSGLPDKTQGYLYVNVTGGLALGQKLAKAKLPAVVRRNLGPLRSAIAYGVTRPSEIQVTFFLRIA